MSARYVSPVYKNLFQVPLPIPPNKEPLRTITSNGTQFDYYEVEIRSLEQQVYPGLSKAELIGYDGVAPGPTFHMTKGRQAVVRFINHGTQANSVHLHGSYSRAPFDGWAEDTTEPGQYKDYFYPNGQNARTLWYHDHAIDHTAHNAYFGQAGLYILHDPDELATPGLPQGDDDVGLVLASKRYNSDGTLWDPDTNGEVTSLWGDVIHVNGQPWPYLDVEPRKYRFRFLDASVSRSFQIYLVADQQDTVRLPFTVVGADTGLLEKPVSTSQLDISMAERWEVVVDFSSYAGQNLTFKNNRNVGADQDYVDTDKIIRFVVSSTTTGPARRWDSESLPTKLRTVPYPPPAKSATQVDRSFTFGRSGSGGWTINGVTWAIGPDARVLAKPQRGNVEVWELVDGGGGWSHPIHIHLIISRKGGARNAVLPYEQVALKDVVWLNTGETVRVIARFAPWDGLYMFHCHNLIHEDHAMMAAFNVTALTDLGYAETTHFIDPMEPKYRAVKFADSDFAAHTGPFSLASTQAKVDSLAALDAYKDVDKIEEALVSYWATHTTLITVTSTTKSSSTKVSSTSTRSTSSKA
ncbi:hypothetical protein LTR17_009155 [Elasticomyces elasticus]|nr:hypothetical protein LTR17_009155 [Elasticomyces elasticus]